MSLKNDKIFVQIASYRDPELCNTIESLLSNADNPDNLVICIAFQNSKEDVFTTDINTYKYDKRFKIIDIDYKDSKGACWARNLIQQYYDNEEYTLQLDSHHRFVKGWDTICKKMYSNLQNLGHKKPLITAYLPSYDPSNDPDGRIMQPWKMNFDRFTPEGVIFFLPATIDEYKVLFLPVKARFYSAHFAFTTGDFCVEVQHNPEYYFHGEEISIAVRAYTWGYDLFHPHVLVAWHEYTRNGRKKHWDENSEWYRLNLHSLKINRQLFGMDGEKITDFGKYGFGKERTLTDYEMYAGIKFSNRTISEYTLENKYPPNNLNSVYVRRYKHCIDIHKSQINHEDDYQFIAVILEYHDERGYQTIYRKDLLENEIKNLLNIQKYENKEFHNIWVEFYNKNIEPNRFVVWPYIKNIGWGNKIEGKIGEN